MSVINLTQEKFQDEVLNSKLPVLVDFYAPWCGPCKTIAPIVSELATKYEGKVKVLKVDIDEEPQIAGQYGVMSIPTLIFFKNGEKTEEVNYALNKEQLEELFQKVLG